MARRHLRRRLRPAEAGLLERYRDALRGEVLDLGPSGGALMQALTDGARSLTGLGPSAAVVDRCRRLYPEALFVRRDMRDLDAFVDGQFTAVVAGRRVLDLLGDLQRRLLLEQLHRVLAYDGVLLFSSHNLGSESLVPPPARNLTADPVRLVNRLARLPQALRNRAHLGRLQEREHGYAILNTPDYDYSLLHYYVTRDAQESQLEQHGFRMLECVKLDGTPVGPGDLAYGAAELYYAARPVG